MRPQKSFRERQQQQRRKRLASNSNQGSPNTQTLPTLTLFLSLQVHGIYPLRFFTDLSSKSDSPHIQPWRSLLFFYLLFLLVAPLFVFSSFFLHFCPLLKQDLRSPCVKPMNDERARNGRRRLVARLGQRRNKHGVVVQQRRGQRKWERPPRRRDRSEGGGNIKNNNHPVSLRYICLLILVVSFCCPPCLSFYL